jgi:head-tail adaptor
MTGPAMTLGALRQLVELDRPVPAVDALGGRRTQFEPAGAVWAQIEVRTASLGFAAAGPEGQADLVLTLHPHPTIGPGWRLRFAGRTALVTGRMDAQGPVLTVLAREDSRP